MRIAAVERSGESEGCLLISVVGAGEGVGADIEALVLQHDHWQGFGHGFGGDHLAVHVEGAGAADAPPHLSRSRSTMVQCHTGLPFFR